MTDFVYKNKKSWTTKYTTPTDVLCHCHLCSFKLEEQASSHAPSNKPSPLQPPPQIIFCR